MLYLGDAMTSDPLKSMTGHSNSIWGVAFTPDGEHAVSGDADGRLIFWDLARRHAQHQVKLNGPRLRSMTPQPSGRRVIFGTERLDPPWLGSIGDWDVTSDGPARQLAGEDGHAHLGLALLPHDAIVSADRDGLVRIWEPSTSISKARQLSKAGKRSEALPEYDKAVANRPSDPRLLIERGRLLATLGQAEKAAADFENAANLAPESPQFFLDAPWWVAGPYPPDYSQAGALENATATDPSQPAPPLGTTTIRWHDIAPHQQGSVNFEELFKTEGVVIAYAMTIVYSAHPREAVLLIGTDDTAHIWLNGREVFLSKSSSAWDSSRDSRHTPVRTQHVRCEGQGSRKGWPQFQLQVRWRLLCRSRFCLRPCRKMERSRRVPRQGDGSRPRHLRSRIARALGRIDGPSPEVERSKGGFRKDRRTQSREFRPTARSLHVLPRPRRSSCL